MDHCGAMSATGEGGGEQTPDMKQHDRNNAVRLEKKPTTPGRNRTGTHSGLLLTRRSSFTHYATPASSRHPFQVQFFGIAL